MVTKQKGVRGALETTVLRVAEKKTGNVSVVFFVEATTDANEVVHVWCQLRRLYSTLSSAGEARSFEAGDLDAVAALLKYADTWLRKACKTFVLAKRWPYGFEPDDLVGGNPDALATAPNVVESWESLDMRATLYENEARGDLVRKVVLHRAIDLPGGAATTQTIPVEHVGDALVVAKAARDRVRELESSCTWDDAAELLTYRDK